MTTEFPQRFRHCLRSAAERMGKMLRALEWPSANVNAPVPEANAVMNIAICLASSDPPFDLYAEGAVASEPKRGRIDLIGFDGEIAFALEAKRTGNIDGAADGIWSDAMRLQRFSPSYAVVADREQLSDWWVSAKSRWAIVVVVSFAGTLVKQAWCAKSEAEFRRLMNYPAADAVVDVNGKAFMQLDRQLRDLGATRGAELITDGKHWGCAEGWLLWAAFPGVDRGMT